MGDAQHTQPLSVPIHPGSAELSVKKSTFLAQVFPLEDAAEAKPLVEELRTQHFKAGHVAWAFVVGPSGEQALRYSDDGEPSGTAGRPILGLIQKRDHTNTLVTVVRYFGGVKLGTGGLVRAYSGAAREALDATVWEPLLRRIRFRFSLAYDQWPVVEPVLQQAGTTGLEIEFLDNITVTGRVVDSAFDALEKHLIDLCRGRVRITTVEE